MSRKHPQQAARRGAIAVLAAILMVVMVGMVAFAIDLGMIMVHRTNIQRAVDAASLAGSDVLVSGGNRREIKDAVEYYLTANGVDVSALGRRNLRIQTGTWDSENRQFQSAPLDESHAIRVFVETTDNRFYFAPVLGRTDYNATAEAIVASQIGGPQDVQLVIDRSGSMRSNNRMRYTKGAANVLLDTLGSNSRAGLALYNQQGWLETGLDYDFDETRDIIDNLRTGGYTNIAGGMRAGIEEHQNSPRSGANKVMVLLTDGRANRTEPPGTDPWNSIEHYADVAKDENITIHTVTLGSNASGGAMEDVADTTGGTYHHIQDGDYSALEELFRQIGSGLTRPTLVQ